MAGKIESKTGAGQDADARDVAPESDDLQITELLNGASRTLQDPDVDLTNVLIRLRGASDGQVRSELAKLVANADPD